MRKWGTLALGIMLALGLASPAHASPIHRRYVAQTDDFATRAFVSGLTGVPMRSTVTFVPKSTTVSITLEDTVGRGSIPVVVSTAKSTQRLCMRPGSATTVSNLVTGGTAWVYVLANRGSCQSGGTTGLLSIL